MKTRFRRLPQPDLAALYHQEKTPALAHYSLNASILLRSTLHRDQVELVMLEEPFQLGPQLEILKRPFIEHLVSEGAQRPTNGPTVRLQDFEPLRDGRIRLSLQNATYFDYMLTNWAASQNYAVEDENGDWISLRHMVEPGPKLTALPLAQAANHIGVVCLLLCEGHLLMNERGNQITDQGLWGLSASGTLQNDGHATSPFDHILAELTEETGLDEHYIDLGSLRLLGIAREFHRAGKPEFYFTVNARKSLPETKARVDRRTGIDAWESVRSDWLNVRSEYALQQLEERRLQPSARIGLWFLIQWLGLGDREETRK